MRSVITLGTGGTKVVEVVLVVVLVVKFLELEDLGPFGSCVLPLILVISGSFKKVANILVLVELN